MKKYLLILFSTVGMAQAPYPHTAATNFSAERVASFGVMGTPNDLLEITNSTQFDNSFIPSIWGHQQSDTRYVLRLFATTTSTYDIGDSPIMVFRSELRNSINLSAPQNSTFPWGISAADVVTRPVFAWENGNTQLMTMRANGFLGLGTTTPTALFHTTGTIRFQNLPNNTNPSYMLGTDASGNVFEYPVSTSGGTADADWLKPDGTVPMAIGDTKYTNGLIGFNTSNPTANIHANGTVRFQNLANATTASFMLGTDASGNVFEYPVPTGGTTDADWLKPDGTVPMAIGDTKYTNGLIGFNTSNPTANIHANGTVRFQNLANATTASFMLGTDANGNVFEYPVPTGGTTDADWLKPDGTVPMLIGDTKYTNGLIGFNTSNPTANIHAKGTVRFEDMANATTPSFMLGTDANGNVFEYPVPTGGTTDADWLKPDGTVPMLIGDTKYTNGLIGFNTSNPTANIHANGTVRFQNLANATTASFMLGTDASGNVFEYPVPTGGTTDADWLKPDGTVPMLIGDTKYTNGLIGFNTSNPTANIHAKGTVRFEDMANATTPSFMLGTDANGNVFEYPVPTGGTGTPDADWLKPDGTVPMLISDTKYTNGFIGFNTSNPTANIHAKGTVRFEDMANATTPSFMLGTDANGNVFEYPVPEEGITDADWLKPDGTIPMSINDVIYTNGKVGINTNIFPSVVGTEDISSYNLFVAGGILTEEVRIALQDEWADYVFAEGYKLPTLKQVEEHIAENGHLINIPSAKQVKENGVELGEMNKLLLEKVEELTLYMIELNKKLEAQQKEIEILKQGKK
ncbi:hypothetical protein LRS05_14650 [Flavobacterium sp. J372]|uniref:hypothetical protein n=1 Tax=Flavobacterium sp. J372 TaxID=2898436 RepID=UPI0021514644|nr:hypothetical protein [Flavobacterium sp. J372]MCR5863284.1 hypothetical protein [Flavobacterium sp. J372]